MTLLDFEELCRYWAQHPPLHLLVASFVGAKPQTRQKIAEPGSSTEANIALAPGFAAGDIHLGCAEPPIFDFAAAKARERERFSARSR